MASASSWWRALACASVMAPSFAAPLATGKGIQRQGHRNKHFSPANVLIQFGAMKNKIRKRRVALQPFQSGQIWQMEDSILQIGLIGKTLVHYKHFKGQMKRSPVSLLNKNSLERFLQEHRAVLVRGLTASSPSRRLKSGLAGSKGNSSDYERAGL